MFPDAKSFESSVRTTGLLCRRLEKEYEKVEKPKCTCNGLERFAKRYLKTIALLNPQGFLS